MTQLRTLAVVTAAGLTAGLAWWVSGGGLSAAVASLAGPAAAQAPTAGRHAAPGEALLETEPPSAPLALALEAVQTPAGPVRLAWRWQAEGASPVALELVRALHPDALAPAAGDLFPAARWRLAGGPSGTFLDPAPADGVTYLYQLHAGAHASGVVALTTAARPLPAVVAAPRLRVDKATYVMTLLDGERVIRRLPFAMGRAPTRRKLHFDNASTPEGIYRVVALQPRATYHKAFDLDYPNALDRARHAVAGAGRPGFPAIGGEIQIHAGGGTQANWTFGCMALRDADIDELFARKAVRVGTEVRIWGGELSEAEVDAMAAPPAAAALRPWRAALAAHGFVTDGAWGPALWAAIGRYQRAHGLPATCWPDAVTGRHLGLARANLTASRGDTTVRDGSYRTVAHVERDGSGWTVKDGAWRTVGHLVRDGDG